MWDFLTKYKMTFKEYVNCISSCTLVVKHFHWLDSLEYGSNDHKVPSQKDVSSLVSYG